MAPLSLAAQTISNVIWSFAIMEYNHKRVLSCLIEEALRQIHYFNSQGIANTLWALATLGIHHEQLFTVRPSSWLCSLGMTWCWGVCTYSLPPTLGSLLG